LITEADALAALIAEAAELLQTRSGGQAVCALTKAGESVPAVKYAEGRWAALREVQRAYRPDTELAHVSATVAATWVTQRELVVARSAGSDWIAYRSGGVDALTELIEQLG
jgi:hypothetical protein